MSDVDRLRTRLRWQSMIDRHGPDDLRVAVLASFTVEPLLPYLATALADAGVPAWTWVGPFHQIERQCLDPDSATVRFAPEMLVVAPRFEELWLGRPMPLHGPSQPYAADLYHLLDACLDATGRWGAELVFVLPAIPEARPTGVGDDGNVAGVVATATRIREELRDRLAGRPGVTVVDAELVLRSVGARHAYRPALMATARIPYSEEYFALLAERISRTVVLRRRPGPSLVVVDAAALSATGGAATADGDRSGADLSTSLERTLVELQLGGARVALCNATEETRARLAAIVPLAGWRDGPDGHATQVRELAAQHAGSLWRTALLTADPAVAAAVTEELAEVTVVALGEDRERWPQLIAERGVGDQLPPADRPVAATPPAAVGAVAGAAVPSLERFLAGLRLEVDIAPLAAPDREAAADLTRRVSEFHLNGDVWTAQRFAETTGACLGIRVRDRFGDYGLAGVVVVQPVDGTLTVPLCLLTCPVLGKGVEQRLAAEVAAQAAAHGCADVVFDHRPTGRNELFERYLETFGAATGPVPAANLDRRPAQTAAPATGTASPATAAPRRRPAANGVQRRRLTSASQIMAAVESRTRPAEPAATAEQGAPPRTEMERRVAELFTAVLRSPTTGVERNFFAAGDSMMAVRLIAKANESGLRITLRQIFQHQTVGELAAVATVAEPRVAARTGADGPAPLLPLQTWFFGLDLRRPQHFNQSQRFELPMDVDAAALEAAVAAVVAHHQSLRVRFAEVGGQLRQVDPGPPARPPFERLDFSAVPAGRREEAITAQEAQWHLAMNPAEGKVVRFALYTFGDQPPQLLAMLHHLAIDGISWRILFGDLQQAYQQIRTTGAADLAPIGMPLLAWAHRLHEYANSDEVRAELPQWLSEPRATVEPLNVELPEGRGAGGLFDRFSGAQLSAADTRALEELALRVYRVPVDALLVAAANRALARWTGRDRFLVDVVNHGREPFLDGVDVSRTIGWLVLNVPILFELDGAQEITDLVPETVRQMRRWSAHHGAGDSLLRHLSDDDAVRKQLAALPGSDVLFSYAGHVDAGSEEYPLLGAVVEGHGSDLDPQTATPYLLQFDTIVIGGQLRLEVCYRDTQYRKATMDALLAGWTAGLRALLDGSGTAATPEPLPQPVESRV